MRPTAHSQQMRAVRALHAVAVAASGALDPAALAQLAIDHARDLLGVESASLYRWDPVAGVLRHLAYSGLPPAITRREVPPGEGVIGQAFARRAPVVVDDYQTWEHALPESVQRQVRAAASVPLLVGDQPIGALMVRTSDQRRFSPDEVRLLALFASQIALALEAGRLYAEAEQRRTEAAARASELATVIERLPCGVMVLDAQGRLLLMNDACRRIRGDPPAATQPLAHQGGVTLRDARTGRPIPPAETAIARALAGEATAHFQYLLRRPGETEDRQIEGSVVPLRDAAGAVSGVIAVVSDLTEERKLVRELAISAEHLRTLYQSVGCGIVVRDASGAIVDANAAAEEIIGLSVDQMRARGTGMLWPAIREDGTPQTDETRTHLVALRTRQPVRGYIFGMLRGDGNCRWVQVDSIPVLGPDGEPVQVVSSYIDVTQRKEAERRLQDLAQADKLRAVGQMASGIAHDLNQYLGLVVGHGDLAMQALSRPDPDVESLRDSLRLVVQAAMDGAETVKRLLAFARPRQDADFLAVDLGELLREVAKLTAPQWRDAAQAEGRPISLHVEIDGSAIVDGSPQSLREALTNLILNAVDALPRGGAIHLAAQRRGDRVLVEVVDTGVGMPADVRARAFEPFFSTKGERGTGLGLAVVYGVVEQHHAEIAVDSAPGRGTTFRLSFPASSGRADSVVASPPPTRPAARRILAVDDDPALARMAATMLATDGHTVVLAASGEEALDHLAREPFDLVLSDLSLGAGMNGWEFAQQVRARHPDVRFCLATGWGAEIDPEAAAARGVDAVVAKPYRLVDLKRAVNTLLAG